MRELGSVAPARRRWRRTLRAGLFWTALGLGAASISYACDPDIAARSLGFERTLAIVFFTLVPIPALGLGVSALAMALRLRTASGLAERTAAELRDRLPAEFVIVPHYRPRDRGEDEVPLVVIGPPGVVVIEPRSVIGEVLCYEDQWYRKREYGVGRRMSGGSPSQRARRNASRVRRDVANGGFMRTTVEPLVLFTDARVNEPDQSSVTVFEGVDALVAHLMGATHDVSHDRAQALANALVGPVRLAVV